MSDTEAVSPTHSQIDVETLCANMLEVFDAGDSGTINKRNDSIYPIFVKSIYDTTTITLWLVQHCQGV